MPSSQGSHSAARMPMKSASAPQLEGTTNASIRKTLRNRGENDFGMVLGHNPSAADDVYVPRAMWSDTADNPLKQAGNNWDAKAFVEEEKKREQHRLAMKEYYRRELDKQLEENKAFRQAKNSDFEDMAKTVTADSFNKQRRTQMEKDNEHEKRMAMRRGLDEQMALIEERAKEARLQDLMEGAEIKARSIQLLCEDLDAQKKRREELKKHGNETLEAIARRATNNSNEKQMERDELNARMREQLLQEQYRLAAQQERLKAAQRTADAKEARYFATAGRDLEERYRHESMRQDRDEKQHNLRLQLHYARREAARKKQQEKVLQGMRMQQGAADNSRELDRMGKERERDAVNDAVRRAGEAEGAKLKRQREAELALQAEHAKMMLQKQQRDKAEADWPRPRITPGCSMAIDQSFVDMTEARAKGATVPKSYKPMHQVDAAKDLSKPLGAPRVKPWVDLAKSYGPGGVNGVFMGDGRTKQSLMATGGCRRILTEATARKTWSEGIGAEDMKAGEQAALQRHHANLLDKTDRF
mmetsp:Transcript_65457/g.153142  ORF Transcript_65457/g.153142 Transcript_65457/m.153142 type:complete len:530 (-) Transcript_65457:171-1760(-)